MSELESVVSVLSQAVEKSRLPTVPKAELKEEQMRSVARQFETAFLAEMLKHTGVGKPPETFNGGAGESSFSGMLTWEYAQQISENSSTGLAERVYQYLRARSET